MLPNCVWGRRSEGVRLRALAAALSVLVAGVVHAGTGTAHVTVTSRGEVYEVRGAFVAAVTPEIAWAVLTDYERIPEFVRSMRSSEVRSRDGARVRLRQRATASSFFVKRTVEVELDVVEEAGRRIAFTDVDGRDFRLYTGAWTIEPTRSGTEVRYALVARPRGALPGFVGRSAMGSNARKLLEEVHAEMLRLSMIADGIQDTSGP